MKPETKRHLNEARKVLGKCAAKVSSMATATHQLSATEKEMLIDLNKRIKELGQQTMHNAFHHEALGFAREVKNQTLTGFFTKRLVEIESQMENNRIFPA